MVEAKQVGVLVLEGALFGADEAGVIDLGRDVALQEGGVLNDRVDVAVLNGLVLTRESGLKVYEDRELSQVSC